MVEVNKIFKQCAVQIQPSRGISMKEQLVLSILPKVNHGKHSEAELVRLARRVVEKNLGRTNITAKDMRNAIINLLTY